MFLELKRTVMTNFKVLFFFFLLSIINLGDLSAVFAKNLTLTISLQAQFHRQKKQGVNIMTKLYYFPLGLQQKVSCTLNITASILSLRISHFFSSAGGFNIFQELVGGV